MREAIWKFTIPLQATDAGGIMYHSNHIVFAELARAALLRELGITNLVLDAVELNIEYMRPGIAGDEAYIETKVTGVENGYCMLSQTIRKGDVTIAQIAVKTQPRTLPGLEISSVPEELTEA